MDCCWGGAEEGKRHGNEAPVAGRGERRCRDTVFLILFALFWVGMFVVCGIAVQEGDPDRLIYGLDSYGFLCGTKNKIQGQEIDLRARKNMYFLDPLQIMDPVNYLYAKSVCVRSCPAPVDRCDVNSLPCRRNNLYRCPYYMLAPVPGLYRSLNTSTPIEPFNTAYYSSLVNTTITNCTKTLPSGVNTKFAAGVNVTNMTCGEYYQLRSQYGKGPCYPVWVSTVEFVNRCYPDSSLDEVLKSAVEVGGETAVKARKGQDLVRQLGTLRQRAVQYIADLQRGYEVLAIAGICGGLVLSLLWIIILRFCVGLMAWLTIIALNVLTFGIMLYSYDKAGYLTKAGAVGSFLSGAMPTGLDPARQYQRVWLIMAIVMTLLFVLLFLLTIVLIRRIRIAVAVIKEASRAVAAMPSVLLYPLIPFAFNVGLLLYWVYIFALLYSAGTKTPHFRSQQSNTALSVGALYNVVANTTLNLPPAPPVPPAPPMSDQERADKCPTDPNCYFTYKWDQKLRYAFIYHLFGLLWTYQWIMGATYITLGGAFGFYYWAGGQRSQMPADPVLVALRNTSSFHLGSAALGGAIVALLMLVRIVLKFIVEKTRGAATALERWLCCCTQCCLYCLQKIVEFINKQAYILIGIKGYGYCEAASNATSLILSNAGRMIAVDVLSDIMLFLGKLAVTAGCVLLAFVVSDQPRYVDRTKHPKTYISTPLLLVIFSGVIGYIIANVFFSVYDIGIEAIILCFCDDCNSNGGVPRYAPDFLADSAGAPRVDHDSDAGGADGYPPYNKDAGSPGAYDKPHGNGYGHRGGDDYDDGPQPDYRQQQQQHAGRHTPQSDYDAPPPQNQYGGGSPRREPEPRGGGGGGGLGGLMNQMFQFQAQPERAEYPRGRWQQRG